MKIPRVRSLRFRLSLINGLVICSVMACIGLVRYQTVSFRSHRNFDADLLRDGEIFVGRMRAGSEADAWSTQGVPLAEALTMDEFRSFYIVTNSEGKVLRPNLHASFLRVMSGLKEMEAVLRQRSGFRTVKSPDGESYRILSLPVPGADGSSRCTVHLGRAMTTMDEVLGEYLRLYLYSVPVILLTSVLVGWFLAGRALRPFEEIARTAGQITSENLNTQIVTRHREEEVQALVQSFNAMVSRLERSFRQMRQFNADAAHELRTPLAILQGEIEIALRSPSLSEDARAVLASNLEELDRLTRLVNDMLTLAEAEAGGQVLTKRPVELKPLLHDLIEHVRLLAAERRIRIEVRDLPDVFIHADELWIRRAFLNLLDNAVKYSREGGRVDITSSTEADWVAVAVQDYGIGIAAEDLPRIFDRLYRADPARTRGGGVGLGLSLVRWIVEEHAGRILVASVPEKGTIFKVVLPLAAIPAPPKESLTI